MANAAAPAIYEKFLLSKNGKEVNLLGRINSFSYYESLLSPNVTAVLTFTDTGNLVKFDKKYDKQERYGSVYNALPLTGGEKLQCKIKTKLGILDFTKNHFYVNAITNLGQEAKRESVAISLVSAKSFDNMQTQISSRYRGKISDTVKRLLSVSLKVPTTRIEIDNTKNSYNFTGNLRTPFEILCWLGSKSIPEKLGDPGFFFYETQDGYKFKSIDSLINKAPYPQTYVRNDAFKASIENSENDYKIASLSINKNQNLLDALKSGVYVSRNIFWDPRTFKYRELIVELTEKTNPQNANKLKDLRQEQLKSLLGKSVEIPESLVSKNPARTQFHILDIGTLDPNVTGSVNNNPIEYQAKSAIRYNLLFTQVINITIPCNPQLKAGDVINCHFEMVTTDKKEMGYMDPTQSGNYLILHLSHNFDPTRSFTSLTLVRDTYGLYNNKTFI